jgi:hypothetical protein
MMDGTPLPELPHRFHSSPSIFGAYTQILKFERKEQAAYSRDPSADRGKRLIYYRILGYLILGPSDDARVAVALEVNACNGKEEKILAIGRLYFDHCIRACKLQKLYLFFAVLESSSTVKMNKGRTLPSNHVSRPSFGTRRAMIMAMVVEAPQTHGQLKTNVSATDHVIFGSVQISYPLPKVLVRDGFRCVISGEYDYTSVRHSKELELEMKGADANVCVTKCAYIFPESTTGNANISGKNAQGDKVRFFPTYLDVFLFITWT